MLRRFTDWQKQVHTLIAFDDVPDCPLLDNEDPMMQQIVKATNDMYECATGIKACRATIAHMDAEIRVLDARRERLSALVATESAEFGGFAAEQVKYMKQAAVAHKKAGGKLAIRLSKLKEKYEETRRFLNQVYEGKL